MTTLLKEKTDREVLAAALAEARARTDDLFSILKSDALYERPIPERHRLVFYLGHLEAFDWNLIARQGYGVDAFDPRFDKLFAFGIDPTDGGLPSEPASDWPRRIEIEAYNRRTRDVVDEILMGAGSRRRATTRRRSSTWRSSTGSCTPRRLRICCTKSPME
jgi:hypothetical protein